MHTQWPSKVQLLHICFVDGWLGLKGNALVTHRAPAFLLNRDHPQYGHNYPGSLVLCQPVAVVFFEDIL